jgi:hypothetical protein
VKSYITVEVSIPLEHDEGVDQAALEREGFYVAGRVLAAVAIRAAESGLTGPDFPGRVDEEGLRAVLSLVHRGEPGGGA